MAFDEERAIELRNLFSSESAAMLWAPTFPVENIMLSTLPTSLGWVAAVLGSSGTLVLFQPDVSGGAWITTGTGAKHRGFWDMAFWCGRLCALGDDGTVLAYWADLRARVAAVLELWEKDRDHLNYRQVRWKRQTYLVESDGELLLVRKLRDSVEVEVEVHRFWPEERKWEEVSELHGRAVFVGAVVSVTILATAALPRVRKNYVFFTRRDVDLIVPHAIDVYSLGDRDTAVVAIEGGHSIDVEPFWITPSVA